jgi:hypothetical protein
MMLAAAKFAKLEEFKVEFRIHAIEAQGDFWA